MNVCTHVCTFVCLYASYIYTHTDRQKSTYQLTSYQVGNKLVFHFFFLPLKKNANNSKMPGCTSFGEEAKIKKKKTK